MCGYSQTYILCSVCIITQYTGGNKSQKQPRKCTNRELSLIYASKAEICSNGYDSTVHSLKCKCTFSNSRPKWRFSPVAPSILGIGLVKLTTIWTQLTESSWYLKRRFLHIVFELGRRTICGIRSFVNAQLFSANGQIVVRSTTNDGRRKDIDHVFLPCFRCHVLSIVAQPQQGFGYFPRASAFPHLWLVTGGRSWVSECRSPPYPTDAAAADPTGQPAISADYRGRGIAAGS